MEKIVNIFSSFQDADKAEIEFWQNASPKLRLETLEAIRYTFYIMVNPDIKGMEKVVKFRKLHDKATD